VHTHIHIFFFPRIFIFSSKAFRPSFCYDTNLNIK
jgi:hypothetical protein